MTDGDRPTVPALRVNQWLRDWDSMEFDAAARRRKPPECFFLFSMRAGDLRALTGIQRRSLGETDDEKGPLGVQRQHDPKRSEEIARFVENGYPWSDLTEAQRTGREFNDLRKPGWLPTALVVNLLTEHDDRYGRIIDPRDRVHILEIEGDLPRVSLPDGFAPDWTPRGALKPIEVIDGQHRLWSFDEHAAADYELPVVAFVGLDISWQAYLFWTINIKPKKINPSLAFDLYPLLRAEDWLERFEGPVVYRQTRAQELTEFMWSHGESPWQRRINMLGQRGVGGVTQAAWIRSLTATLVRRADAPGTKIGGLFGAQSGSDQMLVPWTRTQQAAFLIYAWRLLRGHVHAVKEDWARFLRQDAEEHGWSPDDGRDAAFEGSDTYLNQDQGVRAFLWILNDLTLLADGLRLDEWEPAKERASAEETISAELAALERQPVGKFVDRLTRSLARFDWRTPSAPGVPEADRPTKLAFRGSGGYAFFRSTLLDYLSRNADPAVRPAAAEAILRTRPAKS